MFKPVPSVSLWNVEGKILISIFANRLSDFLGENGYINTSGEKVGIPGFPGCLEQHIPYSFNNRACVLLMSAPYSRGL